MEILNSIFILLGTLLGGGTLGIVFSKWFERKKTKAEANKINQDTSIDAYNKAIADVLTVNTRIQERMVDLEKRVAHLEKENYDLKTVQLNDHRYIYQLEDLLKQNGIDNKFSNDNKFNKEGKDV